MAENFLEELTAEWLEYNGYFVRRNVLVGKRDRGGYECELDVVGLHPGRGHLLHVEPSMDADTWATRETRFAKKFTAVKAHVRALFDGITLPAALDQVVVFGFASREAHSQVAGGRIVLIQDLLTEILRGLGGKHVLNDAVPERLPRLRALQLVASYRDVVQHVFSGIPDMPGMARPTLVPVPHPAAGPP